MNMGLSIELVMIPWTMETYLTPLDCKVENLPNSRVGIFLVLLLEKDQCATVLIKGAESRTFKLEPAAQADTERYRFSYKVGI
jgi:hypothetical protein